MSYRYRFAYVNKEKVDELKDMPYSELCEHIKETNPSLYCEDEDYFEASSLLGQTEFFDFGDCDFYKEIAKTSIPLFTIKDTSEKFEHYDFRICDRTTFLVAIDEMRKIIRDYFIGLSEDINDAKRHFDEKIREWSMFSDYTDCSGLSESAKENLNTLQLPYSLSLGTNEIVSSWRYEYAIFELVRFYKTFDWENNYLIFYGW